MLVLITVTLPKDVDTFAFMEGVWVTSIKAAIPMISALRSGLLEVARAKALTANSTDKQVLLYNYLTGNEFRNRVQALVELLTTFKAGTDKERRAMEKIWAEREQQLLKASNTISALFGDIQGITGALEGIDELELIPGNN